MKSKLIIGHLHRHWQLCGTSVAEFKKENLFEVQA